MVTANNGCGSSFHQTLSVSVGIALAQPGSITGNIAVITGQTTTYSINPVTGATGYTWSVSGSGTIISGQNTNSITVNWQTPGNYILSVNGTNQCSTGIQQKINIKVTEAGVDDPYEIKLMPNPSLGEFYLKAKRVQNKIIRVDVMNMIGQMVYRSGQMTGANDYSQLIDLNKMPQGVYVVKISVDDKVYVRRLVKNK